MTVVMTEPDDTMLIQRAKSGSLEATGELYRRYGEQVYWTAHRITGSEGDAQDVLQDVFVGLRDSLQRFDEGRDLGPWLRQVTVRVALGRLRSADRRRRREAQYAAESMHNDVATPSTPWRVRLQAAISKLPDPLRVVLLLKEVEGYSHKEIGQLLGISSAASATRLSRAIKFLRKEIRGTE